MTAPKEVVEAVVRLTRGVGLFTDPDTILDAFNVDRPTTPSGDTVALQERLLEWADQAVNDGATTLWAEDARAAADALARLETERANDHANNAMMHEHREAWMARAMRAETERDAARADHARAVAATREALRVWDDFTILDPSEAGSRMVDILCAALGGSAEPGRDPEPQPGDGPDYHADHAAWASRQRDPIREARPTLEDIETFKGAWEAADAAGATGHRVEAGLRAVFAAALPAEPEETTR